MHFKDLIGCNFSQFIHLRCLILLYKIFYYNQPQYLSSYFKFGNSTRLLELNYPISRSEIMAKSFVMRAAELWNIHVPLNLRSFNIPPIYLKKRIMQCF